MRRDVGTGPGNAPGPDAGADPGAGVSDRAVASTEHPGTDRRSLLRGGLLAAAGAAAGAGFGLLGGAALADGGPGPRGAGSAGAAGAGGAGVGEPSGAGTVGSPLGGNGTIGSGDLGRQSVALSTAGRQPGVDTAPGAHAIYRAYTLKKGLARRRLQGWLRLLSDDIARLMAGTSVLADVEPELGDAPASLTITLGLGRGFVEAAGGTPPGWLKPLPAYTIDRLEKRWGEADLVLQLTCDDPLTLAHADRVLQRESAPFGEVAWVQEGFRHARGARPDGTTMRNLFGQVDGTSNPVPGTEDFDSVVWRTGAGAFGAGGTSLVLRRIAMDLDTWDEVDRDARENAIGRTLKDGGPVTGGVEHDEPDFEARRGLVTKIPDFAHIRRARTGDDSQRIYRRAFNYADPGASGHARAGLLFATFQADPVRQYHPIQQRLSELDLLNEWTVPVGSSVFWIPPAASAGGYLGEGLFA